MAKGRKNLAKSRQINKLTVSGHRSGSGSRWGVRPLPCAHSADRLCGRGSGGARIGWVARGSGSGSRWGFCVGRVFGSGVRLSLASNECAPLRSGARNRGLARHLGWCALGSGRCYVGVVGRVFGSGVRLSLASNECAPLRSGARNRGLARHLGWCGLGIFVKFFSNVQRGSRFT